MALSVSDLICLIYLYLKMICLYQFIAITASIVLVAEKKMFEKDVRV